MNREFRTRNKSSLNPLRGYSLHSNNYASTNSFSSFSAVILEDFCHLGIPAAETDGRQTNQAQSFTLPLLLFLA